MRRFPGKIGRLDEKGLSTPALVSPSPALPLESLAALAHHGLLRPYIRQCLITDALSQESISDEERRQALIAFAQERKLSDSDALERYRIANVLTPEALQLQIEFAGRLRNHCQRVYRPKAEARFLERKQQLDRVVYSLLRLKDLGLARELYFRLQDGEATFSDLAAEFAEGPERVTRGIVGPVPLTQAHPQLVERLRTSPIAEVQEPFQIGDWWLLFRLESMTPATFDESMALQMSQELFEQSLDRAVEANLAQLRSQLLQSTSLQA